MTAAGTAALLTQATINGQRPSVNGQRPTANGQRSTLDRLSNGEQRAGFRIDLDDNRFLERGVRNAIAKHDPAIRAPALTTARIRDVNRLVSGNAVLPQNRDGANGGVVAEHAALRARRVRPVLQSEKQQRADADPQRVEHPKTPAHAVMIASR